MDEKKNEIRTLEGVLAVREQAEGQKGDSRTIYGRAIVFNSESELLDDFGMTFREVILPEAATMDFLKTQDIKLNMLHDRKQTVARWNKGTGSLRLSVDDQGVCFEFEAPKCDLGDRCLEMVRRGDYSGCSFEFYPKDYDVEEGKGTKDVKIRHKKFSAITALTIGLDPAYRQTTVNARELWENTPEGKAAKEADEKAQREIEEAKRKEEEAKREQEAQKQAEAMKRESARRLRIMSDINDQTF